MLIDQEQKMFEFSVSDTEKKSLSLELLEKSTVEKYVKKVLSSAKEKNLLFLDIDGTLVDSSIRFQSAKDFDEIEKLMDLYQDRPKELVLKRVFELIEKENYYPVIVSGRRRSLRTKQQLREIGFNFDFFYIRNSKLYNPTLSSKILKQSLVKELAELKLRHDKRRFCFVEDRLDIILSILSILKSEKISFEKELIDSSFFIFF